MTHILRHKLRRC